MPHELLILIPLAFVAGAINAAIGGGGLIILPGLFSVLPRELPAALMGTDKLSAIFGHLSSLRQYARHIRIPWRLLLPASGAAFCGAYAGASVVYLLPVTLMRPIVMVMLVLMLVYTWFRPHFGHQDTAREPSCFGHSSACSPPSPPSPSGEGARQRGVRAGLAVHLALVPRG